MDLLVIHRGALGDFLLALPALWSLYQAMSPRRVTVAGNPWVLEVVRGVPWIDEIRDVNLPPFSRLWTGQGRLPHSLAVVFSKAEEWRGGLIAGGVKEVWLLDPFPRRRIHVVHHHLESLRMKGVGGKTIPPGLFLSPEELRVARDYLWGKGLTLPFASFHPGAGGPQKAWPPERMARVASWAQARGYGVILIEGPADGEACDAFWRAFGGDCLHLRTPPLRLLSAIISQGAFFLGNDSGITHMAALTGCPTLALFGPTDPVVWAPLGPMARWLWKGAECAPCPPSVRRGCGRCRAMEAIGVEEVIAALSEILGEGGR